VLPSFQLREILLACSGYGNQAKALICILQLLLQLSILILLVQLFFTSTNDVTNFRFLSTGISMHKGYAFVQFTNPFDARNACHGEDGRTVLSQVLGEFKASIVWLRVCNINLKVDASQQLLFSVPHSLLQSIKAGEGKCARVETQSFH